MAEEDQDQKTEEATGKRLDEARERGQIPMSRETVSWVLFIAILVVAAWQAPSMAEKMITSLRVFIEMPHAMSMEGRGLQTVIFNSLTEIAMATGVIFLILAAASLVGHIAQTGLFASLELIQPDFGRLSPSKGIKRLFSVMALVELGKSFGKLVILGGVTTLVLLPIATTLPTFADRSLMDIVAILHHDAVRLITMLLLAFTPIALIDLFYQRYQFFKNLRMTKTEVKDEYRQQEGDPMIKSRLRQIRLEKARKRMMAQVPKADVIVTNPTHYSLALQYDATKMAAPVVLAKGIDQVALRIRDVAEEHKIPLVSNPPLARALYDTVEIDQAIPTQHYRAVAEVISYVYKLKKRKF